MSFDGRDPADIDEERATAKYGPGWALLARHVSYGDDVGEITAGIGKAPPGDGLWLVSFRTVKGDVTLPVDFARAWADTMDTPAARALGGFDAFVATLRTMADKADELNSAVLS